MHEVINHQRKIKIKLGDIRKFLENIFLTITEADQQSAVIAFVTNRKMRELNKDFRGKDSTTDVLSFPFEPDEFATETSLGDIVISLEQAQKQAVENNLTLELEVKQLILHGILHLCGYDHETDNGVMSARELELRDKLQIN